MEQSQLAVNPLSMKYQSKSPPVISFEHFHFRFGDTNTTPLALKDVNFSLDQGSITLLGGVSGAGKTTLCNTISGKIPFQISGEMAGKVQILGQDIWKHDPIQLTKKISYIFQNADAQLVTFTVYDEIAFALENFQYSPDVIERAILQVSQQLEISHLLDRPIHALSGGEKQRVVLAANLVTSPEILILDEPLAFLDSTGEKLLLSTLRHLHSLNPTLTILIVEHRYRPFADLVDNVLILNSQGEISFFGTNEQYHEFNLNSPISYLRDSKNSLIYHRSGNLPLILGLNQLSIPTKNPLVTLADIEFSYPNVNRPVFSNCSLTISQGEFLGIVGNNGSGKTTLLYLLAHILHPTKGTIEFGDIDYSQIDLLKFIPQIGFIFQNPENQLFERTVGKEILYAINNFQDAQKKREMPLNISTQIVNPQELIDRYLPLIGEKRASLAEIQERNPFTLSWGQKRRLNLASIFSYEPELLLVDEPFIGQDAKSVEQIFEILHNFHAKGKTIVLVSHDRKLLEAHCTRMVDIKHFNSSVPKNPDIYGTQKMAEKEWNEPGHAREIKSQEHLLKKELSRSRSKQNKRLKLYIPENDYSSGKKSFLHQVNPMVKLFVLIFFTVSLFQIKSLIILISLYLMIIGGILLLNLPLKSLFRRMKWVFILTLLYVPLNTLFDAQYSSNSEVLFYFFSPNLPIRRIALYYSLRSAFIILSSLTSAMIYTETTNAKNLVYSLIQMKIPYRYAFAFMIGMRYIPLIEQESNTIEIAQTLRGLGISKKSSLKQIFKHIYQRTSTLLISILRKTQTTANAIDSRGFGYQKYRTNLYKFPWIKANWIILIGFLGYFAVILLSFLNVIPDLFSVPSLYRLWQEFLALF